MAALTSFSFATLTAATRAFSVQLGAGATGEVYEGELDGAPVAVKRLRLPAGASREAREELSRRFRAELRVLSVYRHARVVRLLGSAEDDAPNAAHPFALVFELLDGGSLADWLRGPAGEPAKREPPLSALARVDIALGTAAGLAFLHGMRDDDGGGGGDAAPVLHRDVKAANVGLVLRAGGDPYAKLLDCGLAKAVRGGGAAAAAAGASFTGGLAAGTLGYMAPEVAAGEFTVRSEVFSLGVVLLELVFGARAAPRLVSDVRDEVDDADGSLDAVVARADAAARWPEPAARALVKLALECVLVRAVKRPGDMAAVVARLRAVRELVDAGAPPLEACQVCLEDVPAHAGMRCSAATSHFLCRGCLPAHVAACAANSDALAKADGRVECHERGCSALWTLEELAEHLDKGALLAYSRAVRMAAFDAPRAKRELAARLAARLAAARARELALADRVRELRNIIVERDLTLRCSRCSAAFEDYAGCNALVCARCGAGFCGLCLEDCGGDAHPHYYAVHGPNIFDRPRFLLEHKARRVRLVVAAVADLAAEGPILQRALVAELAKADLPDLGIASVDVLLGARVVEVAPVARGGGVSTTALLTAALSGAFESHEPQLAARLCGALAGTALGAPEQLAPPAIALYVATLGSGVLNTAEAAEVCAKLALAAVMSAENASALLRGDGSFADVRGAHALATAIVSHGYDATVAEPACVALAVLANGAEAGRVPRDTVRVLLTVAGVLAQHARVPALVCWALAKLGALRGADLVLEGMPARLFYLLDVRRANPAVTELACDALVPLCATRDGCDAVVAAQCVRPAIAALKDILVMGMSAVLSVLDLLHAVVMASSDPAASLRPDDLFSLSQVLDNLVALAERPDVVAKLLNVVASFAKRSAVNRDAVRCVGGKRFTHIVSAMHEHDEAATLAAAHLLSALD